MLRTVIWEVANTAVVGVWPHIWEVRHMVGIMLWVIALEIGVIRQLNVDLG